MPHPASQSIRAAAEYVASGGVVAFPTETVYGLGASARQPRALAQIFTLKQRPLSLPLMIHALDRRALEAFALAAPALAHALAEEFWPGPLTLVLPSHPSLDPTITGGGNTVGIRAPNHALALALIAELGELESAIPGLAGTSANLHDRPPPTRFDDLDGALGLDAGDGPIERIDGGNCPIGVESTVLTLVTPSPRILRLGGVSAEAIAQAAGVAIETLIATPTPGIPQPENAARMPGPPSPRVISFGGQPPVAAGAPGAWVIARLPRRSGDPDQWLAIGPEVEDFGRGLYDALARARKAGAKAIFVERMPDMGLGRAINARLDRFGSPV